MTFCVIGFLCIICAILAEKSNKRIFVWISILLVSGFIGLRDSTIGIDTTSYYSIFHNLQRNIFSFNVEVGFQYIAYVIIFVFKRIEFIFLIIALITNTCIFGRLWTFRINCSYPFMVFLYLILHVPQTANIMRQYMAMAIVFFATYFLEKKELLKYLLLVLIATSIHTISILAIGYVPIYIYGSSVYKMSLKRNFFLVALFFIPVGIYGMMILYFKYSGYFLMGSNNSIGIMNSGKLLLVLIYILTNAQTFRTTKIEAIKEESVSIGVTLFSYLIGIYFSFLGYYATTLTRVGLVFMLFEIPFMARVCKKGENKWFYRGAYGLILIYFIYVNTVSGWSGLVDYKMVNF